MSNLIDADAGTERFGGYEAELKLVQADLSQQIEQIKETTGEPRKAAISRAERALEEAEELVSGSLNKTYRACAMRLPAQHHEKHMLKAKILIQVHHRLAKCASRNQTSPPTSNQSTTRASVTLNTTSTPPSAS